MVSAKTVDVSVVVCTLNEEKNIVSCLRSLRDQDFKGNYEIILADGNSEDQTRALAKPLADKIVIETKRSIANERQAGARVAKGKIIAFTDADSKAPRDWVRNVHETFEKNPQVSLIYGPVFYSDVSENEQWISTFFMPKFLRLMSILRMHNPIGSNLAIRRDVFETIGGFDTSYITCEDLDLGKRAAKHGKLHYHAHLKHYVSARRVKKWGYLKYVGFHLLNGVRYHVTGKAARKYEDVRD